MDEATANIDSATVEILLYTMKFSFENCTVLTVTHRISTVLDSDRILNPKPCYKSKHNE
jgi:ATP-binding cassette subfamily C (CFTR/MRP) protein 2